MDKKKDNIDDKYETPPLQLIITTHELVDEEWIASVNHTFYGYTQKELFALVEAHKQTDSFFAASFKIYEETYCNKCADYRGCLGLIDSMSNLRKR